MTILKGLPIQAKLLPLNEQHPVLTEYPKTPGEFRWENEEQRASAPPAPGEIGRLNYACPRGGGNCGSIRVRNGEKPKSPKTWGWNGNVEHPDLTPSINCLAKDPKTNEPYAGCGWHGWLDKGGVFRDA